MIENAGFALKRFRGIVYSVQSVQILKLRYSGRYLFVSDILTC